MDTDPTNTTVYIGNLDSAVTEEELRQIFLQFGEIVYVKIPAAKGCGFVQFVARLVFNVGKNCFLICVDVFTCEWA
ncbi:putative RNA recognition motif domain, nucleotide-binding alpha-beta plait domain superfamily [Helianthus annuus]|nr:putative RNA recognition motif domain, nucleotide-binding alpha-beta plait domain superfamily [Helianthus annuus]